MMNEEKKPWKRVGERLAKLWQGMMKDETEAWKKLASERRKPMHSWLLWSLAGMSLLVCIGLVGSLAKGAALLFVLVLTLVLLISGFLTFQFGKIYPPLGVRVLTWLVEILLVMGLPVLLMAGAAFLLLLWLLVLLAFIGVLFGLQVRTWWLFRRSTATAQARVVTWLERHYHDDGDVSFSYWAHIKFDAVRSDGSAQPMTLKARVNESLYSRLNKRMIAVGTVNVRYAQNDPRILVFKGE